MSRLKKEDSKADKFKDLLFVISNSGLIGRERWARIDWFNLGDMKSLTAEGLITESIS